MKEQSSRTAEGMALRRKENLLSAILVAVFCPAALLLALFGLVASEPTVTQPVLAAPADVVTPTVTGIDPTSAYNDMDTPIVITGTGFTAVLSGALVLTAPVAYLGGAALENVTWVSSATLNAVAPWGMIPGVYTLTVVNPDGGLASLSKAFTVTNGIGVFTTDGPYGGSITDLNQKPGAPSTLYALAGSSGLFVSENAGERWTQLINTDQLLLDLAFDAQDPDIMYLGAGYYQTAARSMDGGVTWESLFTDPVNYCILVFPATHPSDAGVVYAGLGGCVDQPLAPEKIGIYRSDDFGATWITKTNGLTDTNVHAVAINSQDPQTMLAGTAGGNLFYSLDGGENWTWSAKIGGAVNNVVRIFFNPYEPLQAWVVTRDEFEQSHLYFSTNLTDWTIPSVDVSGAAGGGSHVQMDFMPGSVWLAAGKIFSSTDSGVTWNAVHQVRSSASAVAVSPDDPQVIYVGADLGLEKSSDGGATWQEINQGLAGLLPMALAVSPSDPQTIYAKPIAGIYRSFNGGQAWQFLDYGIIGLPGYNYLKVDPYAPNRVYYGGNGAWGAFRLDFSADYGDNWNVVTATLPAAYTDTQYYVSAIAPHPQIPGRILAAASGKFQGYAPWEKSLAFIYISDDYGQSWTPVEPAPPISWAVSIAYDAVDPDLVYVATEGSGLWKSLDGGATWNAAAPLPDGMARAVDLATHPTLSGHLVIFAGNEYNGGYACSSQDAGETWVGNLAGGAPLAYAPTSPPTLYGNFFCDTRQCLARSLDEGQTWSPVNGVPFPYILAAGSDGERSMLYLGSPGGLAASVERQAASPFTPQDDARYGGGVYRLTTRLPNHWVFLPLAAKRYAP